jgi:hypothetical protein
MKIRLDPGLYLIVSTNFFYFVLALNHGTLPVGTY